MNANDVNTPFPHRSFEKYEDFVKEKKKYYSEIRWNKGRPRKETSLVKKQLYEHSAGLNETSVPVYTDTSENCDYRQLKQFLVSLEEVINDKLPDRSEHSAALKKHINEYRRKKDYR